MTCSFGSRALDPRHGKAVFQLFHHERGQIDGAACRPRTTIVSGDGNVSDDRSDVDGRAGIGRIASRIGISEQADTFRPDDDVFSMIERRLNASPVACVFMDEAQFLSEDQVWQLGACC